ncbi:serine/arginine repetitive matrix protein 1-like isoform X3 [Durio zibethinus]|uniref:Serine/arginine repetitive matrix protein 1-like isoform X3 n=1 Tax=Durio zibethinus TaxID=66656 RepID=A0A6P5XMY8_DURZI|nr:serine/arginine repetitive matrix protein 1-like isoform X3 [Durio zibethinus]
MSGGFFRGTSADQDTRFSNKQAKLLKSQKFAPELEHLVDMTKVKMDVVRPWIATRVTELLGFEDEVLINFIYGLLDGKEVNGKQVQISLTGFMEKNTGKFMKELWNLLLSAQRNASGVPQQFLDAKEEETMKKKAESDRIANEIQKKKNEESRELEQERLRKMDDGDERKAGDAQLEPSSKNMPSKGSSGRLEDERDADQRNGFARKRVSRSPHSADRSPSPQGLLSQSVSRSFSNSGSYSDDKRKSRSLSRSPQPRRRSSSPRRQSLIPWSRNSPRSSRSPARRRPYSRRRSRSRSLRRSPSPIRRRLHSPYRRRSPIPLHRRSRSPIHRHRSPSPIRRHRSPLSIRHRRSPSPVRHHRSPSPRYHRSPSRRYRRSPSPIHRRSLLPVRRRSPSSLRRRSPPPMQRRSPSPVRQRRRRSSSTPRYRSSSLVRHRSPVSNRRSMSPSDGKSPSPYQSSSLSPVQRRSSPVRRSPKDRRSPLLSPGERQRMRGKLSPVGRRRSSLRVPHKDLMDPRDAGVKVPALSPSPNKSPVSESPSHVRNRSASEDRRLSSPHESPMRQRREQIAHGDSLSPDWEPRELKSQQDNQGTGRKTEASRSRHSLPVSKQRVSPRKVHTPERLTGSQSTESLSRFDDMESRKKDPGMKSERSSGKGVRLGTPNLQRSPALSEDSFQGSEGSDKRGTKHKEKRKHKRSERHEVASDDGSSYDSEIEDRKEAKRRRRKEEKRLRKEEKRRRREERRRRREERHAEKLKMKGQDDDSNSDSEHARMRKCHPSDDEEAETEQKKLEIELRKKALESLKAKKGISC